MKNSYGNYVIQKALKVSNGNNKKLLITTIVNNVDKLNDKKLIFKWKTIVSNSITNFSPPFNGQSYNIDQRNNNNNNPKQKNININNNNIINNNNVFSFTNNFNNIDLIPSFSSPQMGSYNNSYSKKVNDVQYFNSPPIMSKSIYVKATPDIYTNNFYLDKN
jgi:hypothetical protein